MTSAEMAVWQPYPSKSGLAFRRSDYGIQGVPHCSARNAVKASLAQSVEIREVMDIRQAAHYLGISADSLYRYAATGFIPAFRIGNRWRFRKSRLDEWMDSRSGQEATPAPNSCAPKRSPFAPPGCSAAPRAPGRKASSRSD